MKFLKNSIILVGVFFALDYFNIVNFRQLILIESSVVLSTLLPCIFLLLLVNSLAAVRWVLIVNRFQCSTVDLVSGLSVTFKSGLFAYFLPGQLGSEIGRVILASRGRSSNHLNHAVSAAIIDRVMALTSMLIMVTIFLAFALTPRYEARYVFFVLAGFFIFIILLLPLSARAIRSMVFLLKKFRYVDYLGNILKMVKSFAVRKPFFCAVLLAYSMILNLVVAYVTYLIVSNLIQPMEFSTVALMSLVSNISSVIPITPGGVGISEIVFRETGALVQATSVENLAGGYIVFRLLNIASFVIGMIVLGFINLVPLRLPKN
jgi:uncharacterized membrane protein YbhN (UPF0104 family)